MIFHPNSPVVSPDSFSVVAGLPLDVLLHVLLHLVARPHPLRTLLELVQLLQQHRRRPLPERQRLRHRRRRRRRRVHLQDGMSRLNLDLTYLALNYVHSVWVIWDQLEAKIYSAYVCLCVYLRVQSKVGQYQKFLGNPYIPYCVYIYL